MTINIVSIIFFIIAGVSLLVAIYSFVRFNIPQIIGELSGRTAKKSIAQMRDKNVKTGDKSHRPSPAAKERGTLTDKIEKKKTVKVNTTTAEEGTELLNSTEKLSNDNQTELLNESETVLSDDNATTVLSEETTVLTNNDNSQINVSNDLNDFRIIQNIVLIHTNETI
ncbi:hypothetical protein [uncultured Eubacterium sp.]|uniref:hypothetical protein n=1 Tax=uncultured Eubacterium sp. TaxID=165185 RepID=UPI0015AFDA8D|nr:hypothetical protein [uncultured Eubacterium sp.]